jgi:hypothetical protein
MDNRFFDDSVVNDENTSLDNCSNRLSDLQKSINKAKKNLIKRICFNNSESAIIKDSINYVYFTKRCNVAILYALRSLRNLGVNTVLIPDQGGWITYQQFPERLKMLKVEFPTIDSKIDVNLLEPFLKEHKNSVLIINSLSGYFASAPIKEIYGLCKKYGVYFINDVSGSIGSKLSDINFCDIIVGSFGRWKPVDLGSGGFIAFNNKTFLYEELNDFEELDYELLNEKLKSLDKRLKSYYKLRDSIRSDLSDYKIIYPDDEFGINVLIKFYDEKELRRIISYCDSKELEYTNCPRYIRVGCDAVSIEVKRLE